MSDGKARHHFFSRKSFTGSLHSLASRHTISRKNSTAPSEPSPLPSPALPDDADSDDGFLDARESPEASTPASLAMPDDLAEPPQQRKATTIPFTKDLTAEDVATSEAELKKDLVDIRAALEFFLNSRMVDAEEFCLKGASTKLYYALGYSMIQCIKSLMTFEPEDMSAAIECCRSTMHLCSLLKKSLGLSESLSKMIRGSSGLHTFNSMTFVERHAELVYGECLLLKALLGIAYSGDWLAFVKEALNLRAAYSTYMAFGRYLEQADDHARSDRDLASGAQLGVGTIGLILSLLPGQVLNIMSVFGFEGNREVGLANLSDAGQWLNPQYPDGLPANEEGLRRPFCDAILLTYYLVIAAILPIGKLDLAHPKKILEVNLQRFPNGAFWLWFAGRLKVMQAECEEAVVMYKKSILSQSEYVQLHHICHWDIAIAQLALADYQAAYSAFEILQKRNNWSPQLYSYAAIVTRYQGIDREHASADMAKTMATLPSIMRRIAGKSIPIEKFVARKSKKFAEQGRLMLPALELAYLLSALAQAPQFKLRDAHLVLVDAKLAELDAVPEGERARWGSGGWTDDYCMLHMLRGCFLRLLAFPEPHLHLRPDGPLLPKEEYAAQAFKSLEEVFRRGIDIKQDHYIVWFSHYEAAKLYEATNDIPNARKHYELILHPKGMEVAATKGKVSMQNAVVLRASSALELLKST